MILRRIRVFLGLTRWRAVARQSSDDTRVENVTGWIDSLAKEFEAVLVRPQRAH